MLCSLSQQNMLPNSVVHELALQLNGHHRILQSGHEDGHKTDLSNLSMGSDFSKLEHLYILSTSLMSTLPKVPYIEYS